MPRLYREAPLNSIWEGSGNVQCLDVMRALARSPESRDVFFDELQQAIGVDTRYDAYAGNLRTEFANGDDLEIRARRVVERMALALQGSLLVRFGDPAVADAFCASRLGEEWGQAYGTLPPGVDFERIVERHSPAV